MTAVNYSYLFKIELLHKYFANGLCNDFGISPSLQTIKTIAGNKIIAKQYGNKLFTGLQVNDADGTAFRIPSKDLQLTFFMQLNNPVFFNYTNLPFSYAPGKLYYFSNRTNNVANNKNYLSQTISYSNTTQYNPGDVAADNTGTIYQCIKPCKNVVPATGNANWFKVNTNQYASEADSLQWFPSVSTYTFSAAQNSAAVEVWAYKIDDKDFNTKVLDYSVAFNSPQTKFKLDLSKLSPGKYKLIINGNTQWMYINDELSFKKVFAVVEIFNDDSIADNYRLLTDDAKLKSPLYSIDFLNRATFWMYVLKDASKGNINISPAGFNFPAAAANRITSLSPIPLSETPLKVSLALSTVNGNPANIHVTDVACPSPQMLTSYTNENIKYACSEIHLNL